MIDTTYLTSIAPSNSKITPCMKHKLFDTPPEVPGHEAVNNWVEGAVGMSQQTEIWM